MGSSTYFSSDDKLAGIDNQYYYIYSTDGTESLYEYKSENNSNIINRKAEIAKAMKLKTIAPIQTAKWLIDQKKTKIK
ncbi:MAG: hypothetical protein JXR60_05050 [Bacteroidales bacterium]|nr:hypothetical protein [Bacteroidales bacterium]